MKLSAVIEYFFFQDNTHESGINVVDLKVTGMTKEQYERLHEFMKNLSKEARVRSWK